jgi:hypothetical protein
MKLNHSLHVYRRLVLTTNWLCRRVLSDKLIVFWLVEKFPTFYGISRFIVVFKRFCYLSFDWARLIRSTSSHPVSSRSILVLSSHLCPHISSNHFTQVFSTKTLRIYLLLHSFTFPTYLILLYLITVITVGDEYSKCSFL